MEYIALQIYRSANFQQKRQTFQVASFVCVYARIHIGAADFGWGAASMSGQQPERSAKSGQQGRGREGDLQNERDVASVARDSYGHLPHNGRTDGRMGEWCRPTPMVS